MQPSPYDPYQQHTYGYAQAATNRLLAHAKFIVDQKPKLFELRNEYSIYDEYGNRIGSVMQVGQSILTRLLRLLIKTDSLLGVKLEIREADGSAALLLHKPGFRVTCTVSRPDGTVLERPANRPGRQEVGRRARAVHHRGQVHNGAESRPPRPAAEPGGRLLPGDRYAPQAAEVS